MSEWTNLVDIMEDLSVAQGFVVPASIETFAAVGPPAFNIEEEESEERSYYESEGGGGDFTTPDFELIQQMLNMVKEKKDSPEDDTPADSSDLNPLSKEFVPQQIQNKLKRNVALTSIIEAKEAERSARRPLPKDVVPIMFKKKSIPTENKIEVTSPLLVQTSPTNCNQYTPSTRANEYYSKYLARSKLKEQLEEDIWIKAERQMKEIESKKKREAELTSPQGHGNMSSPESACGSGFEIVNLPHHRHELPGDCIVCVVASKHGFNF